MRCTKYSWLLDISKNGTIIGNMGIYSVTNCWLSTVFFSLSKPIPPICMSWKPRCLNDSSMFPISLVKRCNMVKEIHYLYEKANRKNKMETNRRVHYLCALLCINLFKWWCKLLPFSNCLHIVQVFPMKCVLLLPSYYQLYLSLLLLSKFVCFVWPELK